MRLLRERLRARDDAGAVLVIFAVMVFVLFVMAATVLDLGAMRGDVRSGQLVADLAATAGAMDLDPVFGGTPYQGCRAAWEYFLANTGEPDSSTDPCGSWPDSPWCDETGPLTATATTGPYTVEIVFPVVESSPLMQGRYEALIDGYGCERIGVRIRSRRGFGFGGVAGASGSQTTVEAVARASARNSGGEAVSLLLLDPTGCYALVAKGQANVYVYGKAGLPGLITIDSGATLTGAPPGQQERNCANAQDYALDATGTQNSKIKACGNEVDPTDTTRCDPGGIIFQYALMPGQGNSHAYDTSDLPSTRLFPRPVPGNRVTRAPVDHRYNCKAENDCPYTGERDPYIDELRDRVGDTGAPVGFSRFTESHAGYCQTQSTDPPLVLSGDWWVDCDRFIVNTSITFAGGDIIFDPTVDVRGGELCFNVGSGTCASPQPSGDHWIYVRGTSSQAGEMLKGAQAAMTLAQTMVHLNHGSVSFGAGSGALYWSAPVAGNFEDLALWSEAPTQHEIGGQAGLFLEGAFFTPAALPFRFSGQADYLQTKAQFISYRIELTGQGVIAMEPDPERAVLVPLQGVNLIR